MMSEALLCDRIIDTIVTEDREGHSCHISGDLRFSQSVLGHIDIYVGDKIEESINTAFIKKIKYKRD